MGAVVPAAATAPVVETAPIAALRARLDELMRLVLTMSPDAYCARTSCVSGSVGEHVRHVLDHLSSLVAASPTSVLSYDHRTRGTAVEAEPSAAVREMMRLDAALERWSDRPLDAPVAVATVTSTAGHTVTGWSTLARELAFVLSHTIHHQAIVALLLEQRGAPMPDERFGYAPTTPQRN